MGKALNREASEKETIFCGSSSPRQPALPGSVPRSLCGRRGSKVAGDQGTCRRAALPRKGCSSSLLSLMGLKWKERLSEPSGSVYRWGEQQLGVPTTALPVGDWRSEVSLCLAA